MPVRYRVGQFLRALTARYTVPEQRIRQLAKLLPPGAHTLFLQQASQDQRHAVAVYETLYRDGYRDKDLLSAALLHDVGKSAARIPPWQRGVFVLAERLFPRALDRFARDSAEARYRPLACYVNHAEIGARWAEKAGCTPLTVELIRRHEQPVKACRTEQNRLLAALQAADRVN